MSMIAYTIWPCLRFRDREINELDAVANNLAEGADKNSSVGLLLARTRLSRKDR